MDFIDLPAQQRRISEKLHANITRVLSTPVHQRPGSPGAEETWLLRRREACRRLRLRHRCPPHGAHALEIGRATPSSRPHSPLSQPPR